MPAFVTFTRTPHVTAFEAPAAGDAKALSFIAVNAHLIYGKIEERKEEFRALVSWMSWRLKKKNMVAPNFILLGDLNLDLDDSEADRKTIEDFIGELKEDALGSADSKRIYFPFIGKHPKIQKTIRTNTRNNQTFG